jgi:GNAT superfamily N-acetyltransferase
MQRNPDSSEDTSDDETNEKGLKMYVQNPEFTALLFSIVDMEIEKQIGNIICVIPYMTSDTFKENPGYMEFYINILEEYCRKGIGTKALTKVYEVAVKYGKTLLATDTYYPSGKAFLQAVDAELEIGIENRLKLDELDWMMVEQWVREGKERSPETKIVNLNEDFENYIEQYSKLYTETYNQQPVDGIDEITLSFTPEYFRHKAKTCEETGARKDTLITVEKNGEMSGLTEMAYNPGYSDVLTQGLTGVKEEHRGRGLGKWLKAAMLLQVREKYPQIKTIRTENVTTNAPMLSINNRLGFKFFRESIEAHLTIDKLRKYLNKKNN